MNIKNIIFDFGGVVMDWDPRYFFRDYFNDDEKMEYFLGNIEGFTNGADFIHRQTFTDLAHTQIKVFISRGCLRVFHTVGRALHGYI